MAGDARHKTLIRDGNKPAAYRDMVLGIGKDPARHLVVMSITSTLAFLFSIQLLPYYFFYITHQVF